MKDKTMKKLMMLFAAVLALVVVAIPATAGAAKAGGSEGSSRASKADATWLLEASGADLFEIQAGQLAMKQGQSAAVKKLGETLARAHSRTYGEGKKLAAKVVATVAKNPSAKMKVQLQALGTKKGAAFDKAYATLMIKSHEVSIAKANFEVQHGSNAMVLAAVRKDLKMYEMHLKMAEAVMQGQM
jgi:putative membrane protein